MVNNKMKKKYITPEALTVRLAMSTPLLEMSLNDEIGDEILTKENVDGLNNSSTGGGKSIWDEEW